MKADWHITRDDGGVLYDDEAEHVALILNTLRIDEATFRRVLEEYANRCADSATHLEALAAAYAACSPHEISFSPARSGIPCPACHTIAVEKIIARRVVDEMQNGNAEALVYGRCGQCGHGTLLSTAAPQTLYQDDAYYTERGAGGAGYENYERERVYRETKGGRLLDWIEAAANRPARSLLEVGSGYGFTRRAAEQRGIPTAGVDLSPHAAEGARRLYGYDTFTGTLEQFLAPADGEAWDVVLYQFVLEHLTAPDAELRAAARAVAPNGYLAIVVPSMDAVEIEIFGASYRSFRDDHLHIFSHRSIKSYLAGAGFVPVAGKTDCNLHLLRGFVGERALREIYESGKGPDMFVLARRV